MKILVVSPSYPSQYCGISTYTRYLFDELMNLTETTVFPGDLKNSYSFGKILLNLYQLALKSNIIHIQHSIGTFGYMAWHTIPYFFILWLTSKPLVTTIHDLPLKHGRTVKETIARPYLRLLFGIIFKSSSQIIVHSEEAITFLSRWGIERKCIVIPHGAIQNDMSLIKSNNGPQFQVGFFGFITKNKGIDRILDVLPSLKRVKFTIAGEAKSKQDQEYLSNLMKKVFDLNLINRVEFVGFVPDLQAKEFFHSLDLLVFPYSQCTASGALHIALAHGCICLTSDLPFFIELKDKYKCIETFKLNSPSSIIEKIEILRRDESHRLEIKKGVQKVINDNNWKEIAIKTYKIYEKFGEQIMS